MTKRPDSHTDRDLIEALRLIEQHGTVAKAAAAIGVPRSTLSGRKIEANARGLTAASKIPNDPKAEIKALKKQIEDMAKEQDTARRIREEIYQLAQHRPERPEWLTRPSKGGVRGTPMSIWSDWHYGEVVRKEEVGGVNEFNAKIAAARIARLVDTTVELSFEHMGKAKYSYPGAIVCLGGDMISGDIHDELRATNDRTPIQCVNDLTNLMGAALDRMAEKFGKLYIPCVVGNHGRATMKPRMKQIVHTSFEWNIYTNLEREFRRSKNIHFEISENTDVRFYSYSHRYLLTHGDRLGVKGGDGIIGALGPIMRGAMKVGRSAAQIGEDFDTVIMGHWHQYLTLPGLIVNNSLKGYDEFARNALRAPYSRPSQALWFNHPEHGITAHWQVYLDSQRDLVQKRKEWVSWEKKA